MSNKKFSNVDIMAIVWKIAGFFITIIRGLLIVGGGAIASSLADVILGALTLDLAFVNTENTVSMVKYAPIVISSGASGVQLILWQMIQKKGGLRKVFASKDKVWIVVFIGVVLMKFADDFMDISIVNYLMVGSVLPVALGAGFFRVLKYAIMFITWILTGFSEIFVVNAIEVMKEQDSKPTQSNKPTQHSQQKTKSRFSFSKRHQPEKKEQKAKTAPFYFDEQTYNEMKEKFDES